MDEYFDRTLVILPDLSSRDFKSYDGFLLILWFAVEVVGLAKEADKEEEGCCNVTIWENDNDDDNCCRTNIN